MQEYVRVTRPDDPNRCEGANKHGQCWFAKVENCKFCRMHGGQAVKSGEKDLYRLVRYKERLGELKANESALSLRSEIGIARIVLEEIINKCDDPVTLMIHSNKITQLVTTIERLVAQATKLEQSLGILLDKQTVLLLATEIVEIISLTVTDEDQLLTISTHVQEAIERVILRREFA